MNIVSFPLKLPACIGGENTWPPPRPYRYEEGIAVLRRLGFKISKEALGQVPDSYPNLASYVLTSLPEHWTIRSRSEDSYHARYFIDEQNRWRGYTWGEDKEEIIKLYCRYAHIRLYRDRRHIVPFSVPEGHEAWFVTDRNTPDPENPHAHTNVLWKHIYPESPPVTDEEVEDILERARAGTLVRLPDEPDPSGRTWLDAHYPEWQDPAAYW